MVVGCWWLYAPGTPYRSQNRRVNSTEILEAGAGSGMSDLRVLGQSPSRVEDDEEFLHWCAGSFVVVVVADVESMKGIWRSFGDYRTLE